MTSTQTSPSPATDDRRRKLMMIGGGTVIVLGVLAFLAYWFVFRDDSAASVDTEQAAEAREEALEEASEGEPTDALDDISGTWSVDTSVGTFGEECLTEVCDATFLGFRIDEELATIGAKTVVGRTPGVTGTLTIDGTMITAVEIEADMTGLITDDPSRNGAIRNQAIETSAFPTASFTLTEPIELGAIPPAGESIDVQATGDLTIHGVTRTETIPLTAELSGGFITVFGQLENILLADYDIDQPRAAVVLSVEDNAIMELQLFFSR